VAEKNWSLDRREVQHVEAYFLNMVMHLLESRIDYPYGWCENPFSASIHETDGEIRKSMKMYTRIIWTRILNFPYELTTG
jgi:hypothetical protein